MRRVSMVHSGFHWVCGRVYEISQVPDHNLYETIAPSLLLLIPARSCRLLKPWCPGTDRAFGTTA
ncbi:hypothetical protein BN874_150008 [Candidatus Contendobacter odensis Run_B_J11]|uniref:Uncharacterized protein n=1 Tax=Candidatus Contendobacter odensis Run_B_J11 TaxID=1400861 RepID=A0A7U7G9S4_9GAMM|nr:hypothetical protein BN874_150008 [Candidatus Contendobacter odensis Run_B_J11]